MKSLLSIFTISMILVSCIPDPVQDPAEDINMVMLEFKNNKTTKKCVYKKVNGLITQLDTIKMSPNTIDTMTVRVFYATPTSELEMTQEIKNENEYHQFFYTFSSSINSAHRYLDYDVFTNPIGLKFEMSSGAISNGTLQVKLMHQPNVKNGSSTAGSVDVQAIFPMLVK
jgi:hypothetical protein